MTEIATILSLICFVVHFHFRLRQSEQRIVELKRTLDENGIYR